MALASVSVMDSNPLLATLRVTYILRSSHITHYFKACGWPWYDLSSVGGVVKQYAFHFMLMSYIFSNVWNPHCGYIIALRTRPSYMVDLRKLPCLTLFKTLHFLPWVWRYEKSFWRSVCVVLYNSVFDTIYVNIVKGSLNRMLFLAELCILSAIEVTSSQFAGGAFSYLPLTLIYSKNKRW